MNKYLYVDSEGRVCRIEAETGAMIPVEWNQPDVDAARKRYELAKAEIAKMVPLYGTLCGPLAVGPKGPTGTPGPDSAEVMGERPIFEVIIGSPANPKRVYRIWASGMTEGFEDGDESIGIRNRIPLAISAARGIAPVAA